MELATFPVKLTDDDFDEYRDSISKMDEPSNLLNSTEVEILKLKSFKDENALLGL